MFCCVNEKLVLLVLVTVMEVKSASNTYETVMCLSADLSHTLEPWMYTPSGSSCTIEGTTLWKNIGFTDRMWKPDSFMAQIPSTCTESGALYDASGLTCDFPQAILSSKPTCEVLNETLILHGWGCAPFSMRTLWDSTSLAMTHLSLHCSQYGLDPDRKIGENGIGFVCAVHNLLHLYPPTPPTITPPSEWTCDALRYNDGERCDCECGVFDVDCNNYTLPTYNSLGLDVSDVSVCGASGILNQRHPVLSHRKLRLSNVPEKVWSKDFTPWFGYYLVKFVPSSWTCPAAYYNANDGCDCACGAPDPDCDNPTAEVLHCEGIATPICYTGECNSKDPRASEPTSPGIIKITAIVIFFVGYATSILFDTWLHRTFLTLYNFVMFGVLILIYILVLFLIVLSNVYLCALSTSTPLALSGATVLVVLFPPLCTIQAFILWPWRTGDSTKSLVIRMFPRTRALMSPETTWWTRATCSILIVSFALFVMFLTFSWVDPTWLLATPGVVVGLIRILENVFATTGGRKISRRVLSQLICPRSHIVRGAQLFIAILMCCILIFVNSKVFTETIDQVILVVVVLEIFFILPAVDVLLPKPNTPLKRNFQCVYLGLPSTGAAIFSIVARFQHTNAQRGDAVAVTILVTLTLVFNLYYLWKDTIARHHSAMNNEYHQIDASPTRRVRSDEDLVFDPLRASLSTDNHNSHLNRHTNYFDNDRESELDTVVDGEPETEELEGESGLSKPVTIWDCIYHFHRKKWLQKDPTDPSDYLVLVLRILGTLIPALTVLVISLLSLASLKSDTFVKMTLTTGQPVVSPNPMRYSVCQWSFPRTSNSPMRLTAVDVAGMAHLSYLIPQDEDPSNYADAWFPESVYGRLDVEQLHLNSSNVRTYLFRFVDLSVSVVAVRGSVTTSDWIQDLNLWGEASLLKFFQQCTQLPVKNFGVTAVKMLAQLHVVDDVYFVPVRDFVNTQVRLKYPNDEVLITGHSLGGGIANLVGAHLGLPSLTFEAPGNYLQAARFNIPVDHVHEYTMNIAAEGDLVPLMDYQIGAVQNIRFDCFAAGCHSMSAVRRELQEGCGDLFNRTATKKKETKQ